MNKTYLIVIAAALMAAPLVMAHDPAGTYKNYCEPVGEWNVHEYGPPATGVLLQGYEDGNISGDCDTDNCPVDNEGNLCSNNTCPPPLVLVSVTVGGSTVTICVDPICLVVVVGVPPSVSIDCLNLPVADYDGHAEYARGGAWILVESGLGVPSSDPNVGAGTEYCYGDEGHHAAFGPVSVNDLVLGAGATFTVASDTADLTGTGEGCGDFESDNGTDCVGTCTVTFPPGLDGSYQVYVQGSQGHVVW